MANDSFTTDIVVETWKTLLEYIPEKDRHRAAQHWLTTLQDNGIEEETLEALADSDDIMEDVVEKEEPLYEEDDEFYDDDEGNDDY
jgi:uncharacterized protein (DUF1697 family)